METWWNDCRETLVRLAVSLDHAIGKAEDGIANWWNDSVWPNPDQSVPGQPIMERALDPAEIERVDRAHRFASMMTRGRWK